MNIMRGDAYPIKFKVKTEDGVVITSEMASEVEIIINGIRKLYSSGEVTYSEQYWFFPMSQQESYAMPEFGRWQVRVKQGDEVIGEDGGSVYMIESQSKAVL